MSIHDITRDIKALNELLDLHHRQDPVFVTTVVSTDAPLPAAHVNVVGDDEPTSAFETAGGIGTEA